jgi:hypothetical protein
VFEHLYGLVEVVYPHCKFSQEIATQLLKTNQDLHSINSQTRKSPNPFLVEKTQNCETRKIYLPFTTNENAANRHYDKNV